MEALRELLAGAWTVLPIPSVIYHVSGSSVAINSAARKLFGYTAEDLPVIQEHYNLYTDVYLAEYGLIEPIKAAFQGQRSTIGPIHYPILDRDGKPSGRWFDQEVSLAPLRLDSKIGEYIVAYYRDVSAEMGLKQQLDARLQTLEQAEHMQHQLREEIEARSAPVVPLFQGILVLPMIGAIDSSRAQQVIQSALEQATHYGAQILILDITGVPVVDTQVANYLLQAIRSLRLVGTETVMVGISPEIAQTIVQLGLRLEEIVTRADLQSGLQWALARQGLAVLPIKAAAHRNGFVEEIKR